MTNRRGKEPKRPRVRLRELIAWLPYSRREILEFIKCDVIKAEHDRPGSRAWYVVVQVKRALGLS